MTLETGTRIGSYEVTGLLGAGGMGEVYRATDRQLGRDVALKVLPMSFAQDPERMARFEREAHLLASLNHANIAAIYGVEESKGRRCLVLELVEGDTLAERIRNEPPSVKESLEISRQIAEALESAHEKGIIHRDLKPANVKLTPAGSVKVLDFGLAKALEDEISAASGAPEHSPTLTMAATRAGIVLGTAAYMSPEQARGKPADRRSDIWSFGVVLYEMLTRTQAFAGETVSDTLAGVLKVDPDLQRLPPETPAAITDLLRRCLEKDPRQRLQSIGEARITIQNALQAPSVPRAEEAAATVAPRRGPSPLIWIAAIILVAAAAAVTGWWLGSSSPRELPARKMDLTPEELDLAYGRSPVISPDGLRLAFIAGDRLFIRDLDSLDAHEVPNSTGARAAFWSPDGTALAYGAGGKLYRVPATGGEPTVICELFASRLDGGAWAPDDTLYLTPGSGPMYQVSALGGDPRPFLEINEAEESDFHTPHVLPDGKGILYTVHRNQGVDTLEVATGGARKIVLRIEGDTIASAQYDPTGYIIYHRRQKNPGVWALPFSLSSLESTGEPFLIDPEGTYPSVARDGTLLYAQGAGTQLRQLVWVDRTGQVTGTIGQPQLGLIFPELSPDGQRVLVSADESDNRDIWMYDIQRGTRTRLTFGEEPDWAAVWLPEGNRIAFTGGTGSSGTRISARAADGTDDPVLLAEGASLPTFREGIPYFVFAKRGGDTGADLFYQALDGDSEPISFLSAQADQKHVQLSPDGKYLAYVSGESGRDEVFLKTFPEGKGKWQVSVDGGRWPRWSRKGDELFFVQRDPEPALMSVSVSTSPTLRLGTPEKLFEQKSIPELRLGGPRYYDVDLEGEHFLMVQRAGGEDERGVRLILSQNWLALHR